MVHPSTEEKEGESDVMLGLPSRRVWTRHAPMPLLEQITSLAASLPVHFTPRSITCTSNYCVAQLFVTASFTVCGSVHVWRPRRSPAFLFRLVGVRYEVCEEVETDTI